MIAITKSKGFTIAELAVAVAVLAVLLFSAMVPFSTQVELRNVAETRRTLDTIKEAIIGFAQANGRLPCPADGNIAFGAANAGFEQFDGTNCTAALGGGTFGVVPWATLGTAETDAWGRRFSYRVSPAFADSVSRTTWNTVAAAPTYTPPAAPPGAPPFLAQQPTVPLSLGSQSTAWCNLTAAPAQSSFALCTLGDVAVYTRNAPGPAAAPMVTAAPAVVISHGKNGYGAWPSSGVAQLPFPAGTPASNDERANATGGANPSAGVGYKNRVFFNRTPTDSASGCQDPIPTLVGSSSTPLCEFDDIVIAISTNALLARMIAAGKLP